MIKHHGKKVSPKQWALNWEARRGFAGAIETGAEYIFKLRVHNLFEAKALIKEMIERGEDVHGMDIVDHAGNYLATQTGNDSYCAEIK